MKHFKILWQLSAELEMHQRCRFKSCDCCLRSLWQTLPNIYFKQVKTTSNLCCHSGHNVVDLISVFKLCAGSIGQHPYFILEMVVSNKRKISGLHLYQKWRYYPHLSQDFLCCDKSSFLLSSLCQFLFWETSVCFFPP